MACEGLITADILYDCENPPVGGLETDVVLINISEIDRAATTYDVTNKDIVTNLQLLAGKTGYLFQGIKQINTASSELVKKEFSSDKEKHSFIGVLLNVSAANKDQINQFKEGGKYVAVINRKWKGASNAEAFLILGLEVGLEIETQTWNSNENDGTLTFTLASADGFEEPRLPNTLLETDYATTLAAFEAKFAQAAI
jgi:hypothetical protein